MKPVLRVFAAVITTLVIHKASPASFPDTLYAVTVSSRLTAGNQETLCAQIQELSETVTLTITLNVDSSSTKIAEESAKKDFYKCFTFDVPTVNISTVATVSVKIQGKKDSMSKDTKVIIEPAAFIHIVQTDKPIYKPGQIVKFRIVSLDTGFLPVSRLYKEVVIEDPNSNRIAQWLDKSIDKGILDLSHPTIPEAAQGFYTISATTDKDEIITRSFEIKEYVLPKFEVNVNFPSVITVLDKQASVQICGKYTYGKPVIGTVTGDFCRRSYRFWFSPGQNDICKSFEIDTDKSGCATLTVDLAEFAIGANGYYNNFEVAAELKEAGTGVVLKASGSVSLTSVIRSISFDSAPSLYKPGLPLEGKIKVTGADNNPLADQAVYVFVENSKELTLKTDKKGIAVFSLDTSSWTQSVSIVATTVDMESVEEASSFSLPDFGRATLFVTQYFAESKSYVGLSQVSMDLPCDKDASLKAQYIVPGAELRRGQKTLTFYYLVMSKGSIAQYGTLAVSVNHRSGSNKGEFTIGLTRMITLAPIAQVVVYTVLSSGQVVADSQDFPIQLCLNNKVTLKFSSLQELPGAKTTLNLWSAPNSLCSIRAIDQSVLLLKPEEELTVDSVYSQLPIQKMWGYDYRTDEFNPCVPGPIPVGRFERSLGKRPFPFPIDNSNEVYETFRRIGVKIVTNANVEKPNSCRFPIFFMDGVQNRPLAEMAPVAMMEKASGGAAPQSTETVRTFFPETWIWDLVTVGRMGVERLSRTVPDTITKWAAGAFCVSPDGFGVAPNVGLTAFQPFFVDLTLPYSVIRGEVFVLKATVFNYLSKCIMVKVTLADSDQFTRKDCADCEYTVCLCEGESYTASWIVTPTAIGDVTLKVSAEALKTNKKCGKEVPTVPTMKADTMIKTLLVEPEGLPQMVSHNALLCPTDKPVKKDISLVLPKNFVKGSQRATFSVLGDLMGRAMKNLDKLLAMPYGCGEQNMLLFAPNIFILNYLKSTGQLTQKIQDKATGYLESGYQRQLNYKHYDGSYSAFGMSDASGNTWLTTFVMKSFNGARDYIYVDPQRIVEARKWLSGLQKPDGCIESVGKLFHNGMKGGVSDDVSLTGYVAAAMLELDGNAKDTVIQNCLACLKKAVDGKISNTYTLALLSYTFTLAGDEQMRKELLTLLDKNSNTDGGTRHWTRVDTSTNTLDSVEVEMTSYVLLALLSGPALPGFGLDYAAGIVRWLAQQQNPFGGFSSTQDTVVALQALAKYAAATYSPEANTVVTATSKKDVNIKFTINKDNRLLYQEKEVTKIPGEYTITAEGKGCVLAQISLFYNIPPPDDFSTFQISTNTEGKCDIDRPYFKLYVTVMYQGRREETNMVVINIKLLSGHVLGENSLAMLQGNRLVKRVDLDDGFINIYLDGLAKDQKETFDVDLVEDQKIGNLKPAVVKIYDYYQTSDMAVADYTSPCTEAPKM